MVFFGAVRTDDDEHGAPMVVTSTGVAVKVTPFEEYPAKGRATGGVRSHRFLRGEDGLALAWVGPGPRGRPAAGRRSNCPRWIRAATGRGRPIPARTWWGT